MLEPRRPVECFPIDRDLVFETPHELLKANFLPVGLIVDAKTSLFPDEVIDRVRIDLPLLHLLVPWNRLGVDGVEVVIRNEDGVGVTQHAIERKLADHEEAQLEPSERSVVRLHILVVELEHRGLHWHQ